jgi:5-methylcytosine-specific restriction enzyme subunit McrC
MLAYAVRFGIQEIKLFYPNSVATELQSAVATIEIKDTLANEKQITITAHQLPIIDQSITVATLLEHDKLMDSFERLKNKLEEKLKNILFKN